MQVESLLDKRREMTWINNKKYERKPCICPIGWIKHNHLTNYVTLRLSSNTYTGKLLTVITQHKHKSRDIKNSKWVWSGNFTITNCRQPCGTARKSPSTITRHQEDKLSKAISSLFPIIVINEIRMLVYLNFQLALMFLKLVCSSF